jgi:hypothetical protein
MLTLIGFHRSNCGLERCPFCPRWADLRELALTTANSNAGISLPTSKIFGPI